MRARRLPRLMQQIGGNLLRILAEQRRELTEMRRQNRHLRQIAQRVEMSDERRDCIRIHHQRRLHIGSKESDELARLRLTPKPRPHEHCVHILRERKRRLKRLYAAEISRPFVGYRHNHRLRQLRRKHGIDALRHGERHQPRTDSERRLRRECRRTRHAE